MIEKLIKHISKVAQKRIKETKNKGQKWWKETILILMNRKISDEKVNEQVVEKGALSLSTDKGSDLSIFLNLSLQYCIKICISRSFAPAKKFSFCKCFDWDTPSVSGQAGCGADSKIVGESWNAFFLLNTHPANGSQIGCPRVLNVMNLNNKYCLG